MAYAGGAIEDPVTNQRLIFLKTARDTDGELLLFEEYIGAYGFVNGGSLTSIPSRPSASRWSSVR